jgi:hypothetical protein
MHNTPNNSLNQSILQYTYLINTGDASLKKA